MKPKEEQMLIGCATFVCAITLGFTTGWVLVHFIVKYW